MKITYQLAPGQEQFESELKQIAQAFAQGGDTIYQARNIIKRLNWHGISVIVKSFAVPDTLRGLIYGRFRRSKAAKSFLNAMELGRREINTPTPIGFVEYREGMALKESFYICHEWPAEFTLREPLTDPQFPNRTEILQALGAFTWQLHRSHVHHRDFSPGNILVQELGKRASQLEFGQEIPENKPRETNWLFCLVDVNRMRFESLSLNARMQNFAMLWASDADLELILQAYAKQSSDSLQEAIALALKHSKQHKQKAMRKERIKSLLGLR